MNKLYIILLLTLAPLTAWGQGSRTDNIALGPRGPVPNAHVAVCTQPANATTVPCSPLATLYTDLTMVLTAPNPLTADNQGNYHFYAADGDYTVQIYSPQISPPFVMRDVILPCDPNDCLVTNISVSSLTPGNCVQAGTGGQLQTVAFPCGSGGGGGGGTVGGTTADGQVAVGTTGNNLQSYANFLYDGTLLSVPSISVG